MSRCFPFPPPGYEKKTRINDTELLTKEKHKEKKHKKDKKDKEKREGTDKKEKDRSKEKHREKRDRKEKHKDRDKDKDRDKEKNRTSDEKKVEVQPVFCSEQKFGSNNLQFNEIKDSKYVQELARRIRDEDRASGSQMVQKISAMDQRAEIRGMGVEGSVSSQSEEKKKLKSKNEDHKKLNGQRNHIDAGGLEKAFSQSFSHLDQERVQAITKLVEKDAEKQMEGKEKSKHKDSDSKGDKHKRDREKNRKEKDQDKEKKKEVKAKEISEPSKEHSKLKESVKDSLDFRIAKPSDPLKLSSTKPSDPLKLSSMSSACEGNLGKRKELEINGYLLDNENRPNKVSRPLSSSHSTVDNGRKSEQCQTVQFASEKRGPANDHRVDIKEHKINGLIAGQQTNALSTRRSSANVPANGNGAAPVKPPHPDTEYLSRILSLPEVEELPHLDDHEWLFSSKHLQSKKPNSGSLEVDETPQVWSETLRIESADISALPSAGGLLLTYTLYLFITSIGLFLGRSIPQVEAKMREILDWKC